MDGVFVDVLIVLTGAESTVFFFDKEVRCLRGVGQADLSGDEVFIKEIFSSLSFFRGERVHFSYFWGEGVVKVDLMIIWLDRRNMVSGFF